MISEFFEMRPTITNVIPIVMINRFFMKMLSTEEGKIFLDLFLTIFLNDKKL